MWEGVNPAGHAQPVTRGFVLSGAVPYYTHTSCASSLFRGQSVKRLLLVNNSGKNVTSRVTSVPQVCVKSIFYLVINPFSHKN